MEGLTRESLRPLLELQRIDSAIDRLDARKADLPEEAVRVEKQTARDAISVTLLEPQTELDELTRDLSRLETEAAQVKAKSEHETERANTVTNAREAGHIQAELDSLARRFSTLEDRELEVMERKDDLEKQVAELQATLDIADAELADATKVRDEAVVEIDRERAAFVVEREELVPTILGGLIDLYEEVRPKKDGIAVAAMKAFTCRACGLEASPIEKSRLKSSTEPIERCENCSRILVFT